MIHDTNREMGINNSKFLVYDTNREMVRMEFSIGMIHIVLVMLLLVKAIAGEATVMAKEGCVDRCGNVSIPYPFGIGPNCYANQSYAITCYSSTPFLTSLKLEVLYISFGGHRQPAILTVRDPINQAYMNLSGTPLFLTSFSDTVNLIWETDEMCYAITDQHSDEYSNCHCDWFPSGSPYLQNGCQTECPGIVERHCEGTFCYPSCIPDNRSRIIKFVFVGLGSGLGGLFMIMGAWWLRKIIKRRNKAKLKMKFFKRNGGLLLQKQLCSAEQVYVEKTKLFSSKELEIATDHYNENRILGRGGQGTVYKGMLTDGKIVAVKKSTIVDEGKLHEFINEVVILSQINHRNVVKLHGCCLETEVPLLVYDFIPNGTLFQYIHHQENEDFPLTWDVRLRIASEVAGALSYLHSAASLPIYHRDIKSSNILLDDKYRAKVADFGTSRSAPVEQTHITTRVHGTFGYLDPEYYQSRQFTAKSDVYSFGVVLAELLTGQKAVLPITFMEGRSLATYFMLSIKENRLFDAVDAQVLKEGREREIVGVAYLANRCLNLNGRKRPTMKEVAMELEAIKTTHAGSSHFQVQHNEEVYDYGITQLADPFDCTASTSTTTLLGR